MKCIILLLAFVALCYSYPYGNTGGRSVNISEDGTIIITGQNGKRVTITKDTVSGRKNIEIAISGPNIPTKRIQINEQNELRGVNLGLEGTRGQEGEFDVNDEYQRDKRSSKRRSQGDTLSEILREYQGIVDDSSYEQLLKKVSTAVRSGLLSESVYDVLQSLNQNQHPGVGQVITGQDVSVLDLLQRQRQMEDLLQQQQYQQKVQGGPLRVFGQQQIPQLYEQGRIGSLYGTEGRDIDTTLQGVVLEVPVPVQNAQGQIMERVLLAQQQGVSDPMTEALIYGQTGIGASSYRMPGGSSRVGQRSIWDDLLTSRFNAQQRGILSGQYGQQGTLYQIVENEKAILDEQSVIRQQQIQQQLQQQQQQQILQQQQQRQWQLQQELQQLEQQQQLQQEQLQQQVWQPQVQQYKPLSAYQLLSRPVLTGSQQSGLRQQLVNRQGKLVGVPSWQGAQMTPNIVPLML